MYRHSYRNNYRHKRTDNLLAKLADRNCRLGLACLLLLWVALGVQAKPRDIDPSLLDKLVERMAQPYDDIDRYDAEVWLMVSDQRLTRFVKNDQQRLNILQAVYREAAHHGLDPDLVLALIQIESHFDRFAVSIAGAQGMMQIMPFWRLEIGRPQDNLTDLATNIRYGTAILAHYLEVSKDDLVDALGRYNGSRGRLKYPEKVMTAWRKRWRNKTSADLPQLQASCSNYSLKACRYQ